MQIFFLTFFYSLLLSLLATTNSARAQSEEPVQAQRTNIKVGVTLPLTGGLSAVGESFKNGIILARSENDKSKSVDFIFEDDSLQPAKTVSAVQRMLTTDKISALIVFGTGSSLAVNNIAENARIPMISISIDPRVVAGKSYVMKHWASTAALTARLVEEVKARGYKRVALVATTNDAMLSLQSAFEAAMPEIVISSESFLPDSRDFTTSAMKLKALKPEAIYILLFPPQTAIFAKQMRALKYEGQFFGAHPLENLTEIRAAEGALDDAWFVTGTVISDKEFRSRYKNAFNIDMVNGALSGYDVAKMIIQGADSKDLNQYLHHLKDFKGVIGTYGATPENDFDLPVTIRSVKELLTN